MGVLQFLEANPGAFDLSAMRAMYVGGAAVPQSLIEAFERRYGLRILHAWGMTETTPLGTVAHLPADWPRPPTRNTRTARSRDGRLRSSRFARAAKRPRPLGRQDDGRARGARPVGRQRVLQPGLRQDRFTDDGWFRTGDIVTIDARATAILQDRTKDLIKSGGEWISSVALENALMGHPAVAEAAVIAVAIREMERASAGRRRAQAGRDGRPQELKAFLAPQFAKFWLPDDFAFIDAIPRTSAGKFQKSELRKRFGKG